jgi:hypothetical protein
MSCGPAFNNRLALTRRTMTSDDDTSDDERRPLFFGSASYWNLGWNILLVVTRVTSEDLFGDIGLFNVPASIFGSWFPSTGSSVSKPLANDEFIEKEAAYAAYQVFVNKFIKEGAEQSMDPLIYRSMEQRGSKTMMLQRGWFGWLTFEMIFNPLRPIHGGNSSEYFKLQENYQQIVFPPLLVVGKWPVPKVFWEDGRLDLMEDPERPFNKKEQWIYVNGAAMTEILARRNARDLARMFESRVLCVHNPTTGIVNDLVKCASGISGEEEIRQTFAEAVIVLSERLKTILQDAGVDTVRVIGHSQGTILFTCAVETLQKDTAVCHLLPKKLHAYLFANCGDARPWGSPNKPATVEYFKNEFDFVSEIGRPKPPVNSTSTFQRGGFYGHLLGEHYLPGFNTGLYVNEDGKQSTLYDLIKHKIY